MKRRRRPLVAEKHETQLPHGKAIAQIVGARKGLGDFVLTEAEAARIGRAEGRLEEAGGFGHARDSFGDGPYLFPVVQNVSDEPLAILARHGEESLLSGFDLRGQIPEGEFYRATLILARSGPHRGQGQLGFVPAERSHSIPEGGSNEGTDSHLQAMEEGRPALPEELHLPIVRVLVLGAGRGPRMPGLGHARARFDEGLHEEGDAPDLGAPDAGCCRDTGLGGGQNAPRYGLVEALAPEQGPEAPVRDRREFAEHVAEAGCDHGSRRLRQYFAVGEDGRRRRGFHRAFDTVDHQGRDDRTVGIDRRSGRHRNKASARPMGHETHYVGDRPRTDGDEKPVSILLVGQKPEHAGPIGDQVRVLVDRPDDLDTRGPCRIGEAPAQDSPRVAVRDDSDGAVISPAEVAYEPIRGSSRDFEARLLDQVHKLPHSSAPA